METTLPEAYALLLVRLIALEVQVVALRDELAEVRAELHEAEMRA